MIEFKGVISSEVREKEIKNQAKILRNKMLTATIVSFFVLLIVAVLKYIFSNGKPSFVELFTGDVTLFLLILFLVFLILFIISLVKPRYNKELDEKTSFSVSFDNSKIVYIKENGFGKREINYSNLKKIIDEGSFYVVVSKENNIRLICEKKLLVQGSLEEFDNYFSNIIVRKNDVDKNLKEYKKDSNLNAKESIVENLGVEEEIANKKEYSTAKNLNLNGNFNIKEGNGNSKTFANVKFKGSKTRNEKSFKFALIGAILGVVSVVLTPLVVVYGINFAVNTITNIFNNLFNGFVVEFFTFIFAIIMVMLSAIVLFPLCVLLTPIIALLSLVFPIYQLVSVNRRWFSWVALVVGILSIAGCIILAITSLQGM